MLLQLMHALQNKIDSFALLLLTLCCSTLRTYSTFNNWLVVPGAIPHNHKYGMDEV